MGMPAVLRTWFLKSSIFFRRCSRWVRSPGFDDEQRGGGGGIADHEVDGVALRFPLAASRIGAFEGRAPRPECDDFYSTSRGGVGLLRALIREAASGGEWDSCVDWMIAREPRTEPYSAK